LGGLKMVREIKVLMTAFFLVMFSSLALTAVASAAGVMTLQPASPQPDKAKLKPGLAVGYVYREVKWLDDAEGFRSYISAKNRKTMAGFIYGDTELGEKILTADSDEYVIAFIDGYMHLKEGIQELEFQSNDGVRVHLGGVKIYEHDGRHVCSTQGAVKVKAPVTGWYPVKTLFFQRYHTSCLDLSMRPEGGDWDFTKEDIYAHIPK
jgi:hypothetical protein